MSRNIYDVSNPSKVPRGYLREVLKMDEEEGMKSLRWMMTKDNLSQDMFLLGPPSPYRRMLALSYAELTNRPLEVRLVVEC